MKETLVVYDNKGKIFCQVEGDFEIPDGLTHIITTVPKGKTIIGVDVENKEAIFADIPKTETEELREVIEEQSAALVDVVMYIDALLGGK